MYYIGIDPGKNGAIVALNDDGLVLCAYRMPASDEDLLLTLAGMARGTITAPAHRRSVHAYVEHLHAMPRLGTVAAWKLGRNVGALEMALTAGDIRFTLVAPIKWQNAMECRTGGNKRVTLDRAKALFPRVTVTHHIADALLIAEYGRRAHRGLLPAPPTQQRRSK